MLLGAAHVYMHTRLLITCFAVALNIITLKKRSLNEIYSADVDHYLENQCTLL